MALFGKMVSRITFSQMRYLKNSTNWNISLNEFRGNLAELSASSPLERVDFGRTMHGSIELGRDDHTNFGFF